MLSSSAGVMESFLGVLMCRLMPAVHKLAVIPATCSVGGSALDPVLG